MTTNKEYIHNYFRDRAVAFPDFYTRRPLLPIEAHIVAQIPRGAEVLDLCCGGGEISMALVDREASVIGIDNVLEMCRLCTRLFVEDSQCGAFCVGDATRLPFANSSFSWVVCTGNSLNSMDNDTARWTIRETARVTKANGTIYFTVLNPRGIRNLIAVAKGILQRAPANGFYYRSTYGISANRNDTPRGLSFLITLSDIDRYLTESGLDYTITQWRIGLVANHLLLTCRRRDTC